ncbi:MAG: tetratricopeptide repeat protein [Smithella sp.]
MYNKSEVDKLISSSNYQEAIDIYNREFAQNPKGYLYLSEKAKILELMGKYPEAEAVCDKLIQENPKINCYKEMKADIMQKMGRLDEALAHYPKATVWKALASFIGFLILDATLFIAGIYMFGFNITPFIGNSLLYQVYMFIAVVLVLGAIVNLFILLSDIISNIKTINRIGKKRKELMNRLGK